MLLFLRGVGFESRILGSEKSFDCHVFQQLDFPMWILAKEFRNKEFYSIRFLFNLPLKDNYWNLSDSLNIIFFMF